MFLKVPCSTQERGCYAHNIYLWLNLFAAVWYLETILFQELSKQMNYLYQVLIRLFPM